MQIILLLEINWLKLPCVSCHEAIVPRRDFWICVTSILSVTELWDFPSLTLASPSLLSLLVECSQNVPDAVRTIRFAVITHIYVSIFAQCDAQKCERGASLCQPGGYNLCLAGLFLDPVQLTGLRAGFCLPPAPPSCCSCASLPRRVIALSYVLLKIEDSLLGKVIYVLDISSWAFLFLSLEFASMCLFVWSFPTTCMSFCIYAHLLVN